MWPPVPQEGKKQEREKLMQQQTLLVVGVFVRMCVCMIDHLLVYMYLQYECVCIMHMYVCTMVQSTYVNVKCDPNVMRICISIL